MKIKKVGKLSHLIDNKIPVLMKYYCVFKFEAWNSWYNYTVSWLVFNPIFPAVGVPKPMILPQRKPGGKRGLKEGLEGSDPPPKVSLEVLEG